MNRYFRHLLICCLSTCRLRRWPWPPRSTETNRTTCACVFGVMVTPKLLTAGWCAGGGGDLSERAALDPVLELLSDPGPPHPLLSDADSALRIPARPTGFLCRSCSRPTSRPGQIGGTGRGTNKVCRCRTTAGSGEPAGPRGPSRSPALRRSLPMTTAGNTRSVGRLASPGAAAASISSAAAGGRRARCHPAAPPSQRPTLRARPNRVAEGDTAPS